MIDGDVNLGVILGEMQLMFSYQDGGLVSLKRKDGIQWMIRPPVPVYWRASTDNDRGNGFAKESRLWLAKTLFPENFQRKGRDQRNRQGSRTYIYMGGYHCYIQDAKGRYAWGESALPWKEGISRPCLYLDWPLSFRSRSAVFHGMEEARGRIILTAGPGPGWEFTKAQKKSSLLGI